MKGTSKKFNRKTFASPRFPEVHPVKSIGFENKKRNFDQKTGYTYDVHSNLIRVISMMPMGNTRLQKKGPILP